MTAPTHWEGTLGLARLTFRQLIEDLEAEAPPQVFLEASSIEHKGREWARFQQIEDAGIDNTDFGQRGWIKFVGDPSNNDFWFSGHEQPLDEEIDVIIGLPMI